MTWIRIGIAAVAFPLGLYAFDLQHDDLHQTIERSLPSVAISWTAIAAGLLAIGRPRARRMGILMIAYGFAVVVRPWQYSPDPLVFTVGFALGGLAFALFAHVASRPAEFARLEPWAQLWQTWTTGAFLRGYFTAAAGSLFVPVEPTQRDALLRFFMLDKALYELSYELNNRPDWVRIPLWGIFDLL